MVQLNLKTLNRNNMNLTKEQVYLEVDTTEKLKEVGEILIKAKEPIYYATLNGIKLKSTNNMTNIEFDDNEWCRSNGISSKTLITPSQLRELLGLTKKYRIIDFDLDKALNNPESVCIRGDINAVVDWHWFKNVDSTYPIIFECGTKRHFCSINGLTINACNHPHDLMLREEIPIKTITKQQIREHFNCDEFKIEE